MGTLPIPFATDNNMAGQSQQELTEQIKKAFEDEREERRKDVKDIVEMLMPFLAGKNVDDMIEKKLNEQGLQGRE